MEQRRSISYRNARLYWTHHFLKLPTPSTDSGTNPSFWNPATDGDLLMAIAVSYVSGQGSVAIPTMNEWGIITMSLIEQDRLFG
jgi:hypothetical protein